MNFELTYNHIHFLIQLAPEPYSLNSYELTITSKLKNKKLMHFRSGVILDSEAEDLINELHDYLDQEDVIMIICKQWEIYFENDGPAWRNNKAR